MAKLAAKVDNFPFLGAREENIYSLQFSQFGYLGWTNPNSNLLRPQGPTRRDPCFYVEFLFKKAKYQLIFENIPAKRVTQLQNKKS